MKRLPSRFKDSQANFIHSVAESQGYSVPKALRKIIDAVMRGDGEYLSAINRSVHNPKKGKLINLELDKEKKEPEEKIPPAEAPKIDQVTNVRQTEDIQPPANSTPAENFETVKDGQRAENTYSKKKFLCRIDLDRLAKTFTLVMIRRGELVDDYNLSNWDIWQMHHYSRCVAYFLETKDRQQIFDEMSNRMLGMLSLDGPKTLSSCFGYGIIIDFWRMHKTAEKYRSVIQIQESREIMEKAKSAQVEQQKAEEIKRNRIEDKKLYPKHLEKWTRLLKIPFEDWDKISQVEFRTIVKLQIDNPEKIKSSTTKAFQEACKIADQGDRL